MSERSFVSSETRDRIRRAIAPVGEAMGRAGISPNAVTLAGFVGTCIAAVAAGAQQWLLAGILVLAFGIFDLFDGAVARATGRVSKFGAFLDSTLDRTGENLVLAGVAVGTATAGFQLGVELAVLALAFASVVTYTRARAEAVGLKGEVGIAPRPERLVVLAAGLVLTDAFGGLSPGGLRDCRPIGVGVPPGPLSYCDGGGRTALVVALGIIVVTSAITVVQRILYVRRQSLERNEP